MVKLFVKFCTTCVAVFLAVSMAIVMIYRYAPVRVTPLMMLRKADALQEGRSLVIRRNWVPIEQISPDVINAVIENEDAHFFEHGGFSYEDILDAYYLNKRAGFIICGGSTISQQTAKNVFCSPSRTYWRKIMEAYYTMLIELFWGKKRILEVYLNVIELGDGVFGVESAAQEYFYTSAMQLDPEQADLIAGALPNPREWKWWLY